jgi:SPP1 gp7 family putative phage head morphogenesis protein
MSRRQAVTIARTETLRAANQGRMLGFEQAHDDYGIEMLHEWVATRDDRTRDTHAALHGEQIEIGDRFSNGLRYPHDPEGPASEVINCRCSHVAVLKGLKGSKAYQELNERIRKKDVDLQPINDILNTRGKNLMSFNSEKAREIINKQKQMDPDVIQRVKKALNKKGAHIEQSAELDEWLIKKGVEAVTFSDGKTIIMHTRVSASGFFEELIHYGQINSGRAIYGDKNNNLLLEIEAKERLIKNQKAYKITDYEIGILKNTLDEYKKELDLLKE